MEKINNMIGNPERKRHKETLIKQKIEQNGAMEENF